MSQSPQDPQDPTFAKQVADRALLFFNLCRDPADPEYIIYSRKDLLALLLVLDFFSVKLGVDDIGLLSLLSKVREARRKGNLSNPPESR
jgi:hypothetical protein